MKSLTDLFMGVVNIPSFSLIILSILGIAYAALSLKTSKNKVVIAGGVLSFVSY
ncbi:hypothetical protein HVS_15670 [Acetivibrio saccincola]|uniref:Uncharacterized protein n=1 Tax=Acetivibrio saccincola TaxID=1677857 RepID=A0A2K9EFP7_9FIRM|nr:hypothetical protein HVS_15670 [Acetivibrio saccincola]